MPELSIIIPTFNEGKYLGTLLNSILAQDYKDYEIIVSDNKSSDSTLRVARNYKCKIVKGGRPGIARNNGAKIAQGKYLLFIDADSVLSENSLDTAIKLFKEKGLDVAGARFYPYGGNIFDGFLHWLYFILVSILFPFIPHLNGGFLLCTREMFDKIKGFDSTIKLGEEHAFAKTARKLKAKVKILSKVKVFLSVRRFEVEGRVKLTFKYLFSGVYRVVFGDIRTNIFNYKWGYKK